MANVWIKCEDKVQMAEFMDIFRYSEMSGTLVFKVFLCKKLRKAYKEMLVAMARRRGLCSGSVSAKATGSTGHEIESRDWLGC
jgi:hypothetical protein